MTYSNEEALEMQRRYLAREAQAKQLTSTGNKLMLLGCQATLLTWFGLPMLFILIAFIVSLF